jgi:hypothetical protein
MGEAARNRSQAVKRSTMYAELTLAVHVGYAGE